MKRPFLTDGAFGALTVRVNLPLGATLLADGIIAQPREMKTPFTINLDERRTVTYALYGSPEGRRWAIYLHGFPGSRIEGALLDAAATQRGVTVVAPDRPGFGSTDGYAHRRVGDWAGDIRCLCKSLGIEQTAIIGVSGGGPYALACAAGVPDLVTSVHSVSGLAPPQTPHVLDDMASGNRAMFRIATTYPRLGRLVTRIIGASWAASPRLCLGWFRAFVPPVDRRLLNRPDVHTLMLQNLRCAFERSSRGAVEDFSALTAPWGFDLTAIRCPVTIWHGLADTYVPPAMGTYLAATIPGATLREFPDEGHLLIIGIVDKLLDALS